MDPEFVSEYEKLFEENSKIVRDRIERKKQIIEETLARVNGKREIKPRRQIEKKSLESCIARNMQCPECSESFSTASRTISVNYFRLNFKIY